MFFSCFLLFLRTNFYFLFITDRCIPIFNIFLRTDHENFTSIMSTSEKNKGKVYIKSPQKVHEMFKRGIVGEIDMCKNNKTILKLVRPNYEEIEILKLFGNEHIVDKSHLKSMNINY